MAVRMHAMRNLGSKPLKVILLKMAYAAEENKHRWSMGVKAASLTNGGKALERKERE